ncbi:hypothetical protein [Streptomyces sp. E-08]|uniref:hypothetical protein n=1 Tax=Streptomyces sp. E-08 TaxID=3404047 RepID=UPI003CEFF2E1
MTAFPDVARLDRAFALKEFVEGVRDTRPPLHEAAAGLRRWARGVGIVLGGFFTLTVGSLGLRALTSLAGGHVLHGFHDLMDFVTIVTTIAVGLLAGAALLPARGEKEFPA